MFTVVDDGAELHVILSKANLLLLSELTHWEKKKKKRNKTISFQNVLQ